MNNYQGRSGNEAAPHPQKGGTWTGLERATEIEPTTVNSFGADFNITKLFN